MNKRFLERLPDAIADGMACMNVPGLQLSVVMDGKVVFSEGFGLANIEQSIPMSRVHLLPIGSTTKAFTAMAVAILAAEKKLDLDVAVRRYLPGFDLSDPAVAAQITPRDLLCHRTGLPGHDPMWIGRNDISRSEMIQMLRHLPLSKPVRSVLQYQNQMYLVAGHLIETVAGMSWEDFVTQRILTPLGMEDTRFEMGDEPAYARLYTADPAGAQQLTQPLVLGPMAPAGGIVSTSGQLTHWIQLMLDEGVYAQRPLLPRPFFDELVRPHMPRKIRYSFAEETQTFYALGWETKTYRGHPVLEHGGNVFGASAHVSMLSGQKLGCAVLTNADSTMIGPAVAYTLYDLLLGVEEETNWFERYLVRNRELQAEEQLEIDGLCKARVQGTMPCHAPEAYCGMYRNPAYGEVEIYLEGAQLCLHFHGFKTELKHLHYDHYLFNILGYTFPLSFTTGLMGNVTTLFVPFEPSVPDIEFTAS